LAVVQSDPMCAAVKLKVSSATEMFWDFHRQLST
jgi:hypothetical protein